MWKHLSIPKRNSACRHSFDIQTFVWFSPASLHLQSQVVESRCRFISAWEVVWEIAVQHLITTLQIDCRHLWLHRRSTGPWCVTLCQGCITDHLGATCSPLDNIGAAPSIPAGRKRLPLRNEKRHAFHQHVSQSLSSHSPGTAGAEEGCVTSRCSRNWEVGRRQSRFLVLSWGLQNLVLTQRELRMFPWISSDDAEFGGHTYYGNKKPCGDWHTGGVRRS